MDAGLGGLLSIGAQARHPGYLQLLRFPAAHVWRPKSLFRSARARRPAGLRLGRCAALRQREGNDVGLDQRAFVLAAQTSLGDGNEGSLIKAHIISFALAKRRATAE